MAGASASVDLAFKTLALKEACSHCGKQRESLKRCSICKKASYCGAECQRAGWKRHKKTCESPVSVDVVWTEVSAADLAGDWKRVLKWEGRMEDLLEHVLLEGHEFILDAFLSARVSARAATGSSEHALAVVNLGERRVDLLGRLHRFRDQGDE